MNILTHESSSFNAGKLTCNKKRVIILFVGNNKILLFPLHESVSPFAEGGAPVTIFDLYWIILIYGPYSTRQVRLLQSRRLYQIKTVRRYIKKKKRAKKVHTVQQKHMGDDIFSSLGCLVVEEDLKSHYLFLFLVSHLSFCFGFKESKKWRNAHVVVGRCVVMKFTQVTSLCAASNYCSVIFLLH